MKTNQQRGTADFSNAINRVHVLNHVALAEINFFQREKVDDLNTYLRTLIDEQIQFYEKVNSLSLLHFHDISLYRLLLNYEMQHQPLNK